MIVWRQPSALTGDALLQTLANQLRGRVQAAYVFGSHARGEAHSDSDVDLVLIVDTTAKFTQRGRAFLDLFDVASALDLLVYTPSEWVQKEADFRAIGPLLRVPLE